MQPLAQPAAAWAGGLCSLPFEHGLEARDLVLTALLPSRAGGEWWVLLGSQGEGSESPVLPRRSPLGLHGAKLRVSMCTSSRFSFVSVL